MVVKCYCVDTQIILLIDKCQLIIPSASGWWGMLDTLMNEYFPKTVRFIIHVIC